MIPETTREALLDAMQRFDQTLRSTADWADWEQQSGYKFAIAHEGQHYPVKQIVSMATGVAKNTFSGGNEANTYVTRKGFTVVPIGDDPTDGSATAERSPVKINNVPVSGTHRASSLVAAFKHFRDDVEFRFRVRLRRWRAGQLRQLLSDPDRITLDDFNHEIWVPEWRVYLHGNAVAATFFNTAIHDDNRMAELEAALESGDLEFHGNAIWGTASRVYGSALHISVAEKEANIHGALRILNDTNLTPLQKAQQINAVPGFGRNSATGLVMVFHPHDFALYNVQTQGALEKLGYQAGTLEAFEASVAQLKEHLSAEDFLELDEFLEQLNRGTISVDDRTRFWWVNQGASYRQERDGGYLWAPKRTKNGRVQAHHANMTQLHDGDVIFHYADGSVRALSSVTVPAKEVPRPAELPSEPWDTEGYLVRADYDELQEPIRLNDIPGEWRRAEAGPFTQQGGVKQGYLYPLDQAFVEQLAQRFPDRLPAEPPLPCAPVLQSPHDGGYLEPPFEQIRQFIADQHLWISAESLQRYHVSLKIRGFVILAGISGTGKTWLTEVYSQAVGARYHLVAVAPNWNTNEDLLGYFNPLDQRYYDTSFSIFLRQAADEYTQATAAGRNPIPYHLALDEMNLARVEYYFAKFLSALEERARKGRAVIDLGPNDRVVLPPNLFFIGTVNVDETTHGFADKVYDRAQLVELDAPREALSALLGNVPYHDDVMEIWDAVHDVAPFAFRVIADIEKYIQEAAMLGVSWEVALDQQLLQKVLPRFKGADLRVGAALERMAQLTADQFPLTHHKASEMFAAFTQYGFASYF